MNVKDLLILIGMALCFIFGCILLFVGIGLFIVIVIYSTILAPYFFSNLHLVPIALFVAVIGFSVGLVLIDLGGKR